MLSEYSHLYEALSQVDGFIYPNEIELSWSVLIVLYPYITGLVAGAFILASLARVFNVKELKPVYPVALITALAFLIIAPLPLISHLAQPGRFYEIMITPHSSSAMAIFGFVYLWYLAVVLLMEIWFDYRRDFVLWAQSEKGIKKFLYKMFCMGVYDTSEKSIRLDNRIGYIITVIGIPSAFLLHGYVGFIFGSIKANPWWSSVMMPVIFIFSAMVSGIALVMFVYMIINYIRKQKTDVLTLDSIAKYLFYIIILDFALESIDQIHRIYQAEESFEIISLLMSSKLSFTLGVMQIGVGTLIPLFTLGVFQFYKPSVKLRKIAYFLVSLCVLAGIFFMRWNVVIGGQLFSKSFLGFTSFKMSLHGQEGLLTTAIWVIAPFILLAVLLWLLPPWKKHDSELQAVE